MRLFQASEPRSARLADDSDADHVSRHNSKEPQLLPAKIAELLNALSRAASYNRLPPIVLRQAVAQDKLPSELKPADNVSIVPAAPKLFPAKIDKSALTIAEPKRLRDKAHLKFIASQPCLVCGRQPSDPHHLRFAQPRAIGMKVSDEFTVPLCRGHHRQLHQTGDEVAWWQNRKINVLEIAKRLWGESHARSNSGEANIPATDGDNAIGATDTETEPAKPT